MPKPRENQPPELITPAELARRRGVHKSTATRACKGVLATCMVDNLVDVSDPLVRRWLNQTDDDPAPVPPTKGAGPVPTREDFSRLQYRKRTAETAKLEIANAERRGQLVERERVRTHVFGLMEAANKRLLGDAPKTIASRLYGLAKSGAGIAEGEKFARETISAVLTITRDQVTLNLRQRRKKVSDDGTRPQTDR